MLKRGGGVREGHRGVTDGVKFRPRAGPVRDREVGGRVSQSGRWSVEGELRRGGGRSEGEGREGRRRCSRMARAVEERRMTATMRQTW